MWYPETGIFQWEEDNKEGSGSLRPRRDLKRELKPTKRMKRKTSMKKAVGGVTFSLRWDSLHERSSSNLQTHSHVMVIAGDPTDLCRKIWQWRGAEVMGTLLPGSEYIGLSPPMRDSDWPGAISEMGRLGSEPITAAKSSSSQQGSDPKKLVRQWQAQCVCYQARPAETIQNLTKKPCWDTLVQLGIPSPQVVY